MWVFVSSCHREQEPHVLSWYLNSTDAVEMQKIKGEVHSLVRSFFSVVSANIDISVLLNICCVCVCV